MLLTKECDYGARIIRRLASGTRKTVASICDMEKIPVPYAYKIIKKLEHAGLLQSMRGHSGGYMLIKPLDMITLYDIAVAVDEKFLIFECLSADKHCPFKQGGNPCAVHFEFRRIQEILIKEMQAKTMREILLPHDRASTCNR